MSDRDDLAVRLHAIGWEMRRGSLIRHTQRRFADAVLEAADALAAPRETPQEPDHRPSVRKHATFDGVNSHESVGRQPSGDEPGRVPETPASERDVLVAKLRRKADQLDEPYYSRTMREAADALARETASFDRKAGHNLLQNSARETAGTCATCRHWQEFSECTHPEVLQFTLPDEYNPHFACPSTFGCTLHEPAPPVAGKEER